MLTTASLLILQTEDSNVGALDFLILMGGTMVAISILAVALTWFSYRNRKPERPSDRSRGSEHAHDVADYEARSRQGMH